ncbi:MAG: histidinol dehydrogenase [Acidobacteriota bacterium]
MQIIRYPTRDTWPEILRRPPIDLRSIEKTVREILNSVKSEGDKALRNYTAAFDGVILDNLEVRREEFEAAEQQVPAELKAAIDIALASIEKFHAAQREEIKKIETTNGVLCWRRSIPIEKVGLYVPAGTAPLLSTVLMLGIPARLAGCGEIVLCSPPDRHGKIADAILYSAQLCGISRVFKIGGAQAIAAMAYGTETVPAVYKIFGPGNQYVTSAKRMVSHQVAIDMPAGPSEVAVLADESSIPNFVAADLLSQAEHGPDSQVLLVSTCEKVINETLMAIEKQIADISRREIATRSLANSKAILVRDLAEAIEIVNEYAAEHLILAIENADESAEEIINAGSVFIGNYSCESAGDYASGTNHTLPTAGFARSFSGVSLDSFVKKITFQKLTKEGIRSLGPTIEILAAAEGLDAHKRAITIRLEEIDGI